MRNAARDLEAGGPSFDALVLNGRSRGGLAVARSLGRSRYAVAVASKGRASRYVTEHVEFPPIATDVDRFVQELVAWLQEHRTDVVLTSSDAGVAALAEARDQIERTSVVGLASSEALAVATSKSKTLARATAVGIPTPRSHLVRDPGNAVAAAQEIGFPCVLKPDRSWSWRGTRARVRPVLVTDVEEAHSVSGRRVRPDAPALVQEFAPGMREAIMLFRASGRVLARFAMSVSRMWPPLGGNSVMRTSIPPPEDCLRCAERLVADIGLDGYSEIEFRRARDGRPLLMEVNARFSQSIELALRSGLDFPTMQLEWARGGRLPEAAGYQLGTRLSWFEGEMFLVMASCLRRPRPAPSLKAAIVDLVRDYIPPPHLDGFAAADPLPTLSQFRVSLKRFAQEKDAAGS
jgi:predicted ATP-grasp superfamily ATP-dependent carboligase